MGQVSSRRKDNEHDDSQLIENAVKGGLIEVLKEFKNKDPDFQNMLIKGVPLLHYAVANLSVNSMKFLLECGVSANSLDQSGNTPIQHLITCKRQNKQILEMALQILIDNKADVNAKGTAGRTPLLRSIVSNCNLTEILLRFGADLNIEDDDGLLPIHVCVNYASPLLGQVIQHGADINAQDNKGRTALYFAVLAGHTTTVEQLIAANCDVNRGSESFNVIQVAIVKNRADILQILLQNGANVAISIVEHRQIFMKATDCFNLALIVLNWVLGKHVSVCTDEWKNKFFNAVQVVDLIIQAHGSEVSFNKNPLIKSDKIGLSNQIESKDFLLEGKKLRQVYRKLAFLHEISVTQKHLPADGILKIEHGEDSMSLQNMCRIKMRHLLMSRQRNVICTVEQLDCPRLVKDKILLKDI